MTTIDCKEQFIIDAVVTEDARKMRLPQTTYKDYAKVFDYKPNKINGQIITFLENVVLMGYTPILAHPIFQEDALSSFWY